MLKLYINILLLISYVYGVNVRVDPLVKISQGLVRGRRASDGDYSTFLGIPYAKVDEDNPFGPTLPTAAFEEEIFNAYDGSAKCPQSGFDPEEGEQSLDCLKVNIHVPSQASANNPLPVLVFIHGGAFSFGSAGGFGVKNLVRHGIVVVTINYRLGPYGFICLDVPQAPGNQGLKDQHAALVWIRNNIASFGGNPYNVTISGQSAGACSALLHLYSDKQKLFHKAIIQSGTPQSDGMYVIGDVEAANKLAQQLGFNTTNTEEALEFLSNQPSNSVTDAMNAIGLDLRPCTEKSFSGVDIFVETDPYSLSNERKLRDTPILIGHTSKEEIEMQMYASDYYDSDQFYKKIERNFELNKNQLDLVAKSVKRFYIGDKPISRDYATKFQDFESDFVFNHPTQRMITKFLEENAQPVYQYVFSYVSDSGAEGAGHSAELKYLFNLSNNLARSDEEQLIVDRMTTLWANFVKYGNPTPEQTELLPVTWTPVTGDELRPYLVIDADIRMESRFLNERMAYWDLFYTSFGSYSKLLRTCNIPV